MSLLTRMLGGLLGGAEAGKDLTVNECHRKGGGKPKVTLNTSEMAKKICRWGVMDDMHKYVFLL